jgi:hypothetical protein
MNPKSIRNKQFRFLSVITILFIAPCLGEESNLLALKQVIESKEAELAKIVKKYNDLLRDQWKENPKSVQNIAEELPLGMAEERIVRLEKQIPNLEKRIQLLEKLLKNLAQEDSEIPVSSQPPHHLNVGAGLTQYEQAFSHLQKAFQCKEAGNETGSFEWARLAEQGFQAMKIHFSNDPMLPQACLHLAEAQLVQAQTSSNETDKKLKFHEAQKNFQETLSDRVLALEQRNNALLGIIESFLGAQEMEKIQEPMNALESQKIPLQDNQKKRFQAIQNLIREMKRSKQNSSSSSPTN